LKFFLTIGLICALKCAYFFTYHLHIIVHMFQSDVWALGCCVYEMTTLKHAFNGKDMNSLMYKILRGKVSLNKHIGIIGRHKIAYFTDRPSECITVCNVRVRDSSPSSALDHELNRVLECWFSH